MLLVLMDATRAGRVRNATKARSERLDPRLIAAGPFAGQYAINPRCLEDTAFADQSAQIAALVPTEVDIAEAWPEAKE
jgi:hypothetical protein